MEKIKLDRINELAHKSKAEGLTLEEKAEQAVLRASSAHRRSRESLFMGKAPSCGIIKGVFFYFTMNSPKIIVFFMNFFRFPHNGTPDRENGGSSLTGEGGAWYNGIRQRIAVRRFFIPKKGYTAHE